MWPLGIRPDLGPKDVEVKRKLVKRGSNAYSKLIMSDIPRPSGLKSSRPPALRPSPPSIMQPSHGGPPVIKPTREELQARVEALSKKRRSVKRKFKASPERSLLARGKTPKLGISSPSQSTKEQGSATQAQVRGQAPSPLAEVLKVPGPWLHSSSTAMAKDPLGMAAEPPLEVMPISVWSPQIQSTELPPSM